GLGRVQEESRCPGAAERGGYLGADEPRLAHPRDNDSALAGVQSVDRPIERFVEARDQIQDGVRLELENLAGDVAGHQRPLTRASIETTARRSGSTASRRSAFGPSLRAAEGSSWTSQNSASMPTA